MNQLEPALEDHAMIDPETGWNRLMVERLVRSIKIAHEINPDGWAIHPADYLPEAAYLSIGRPIVASVGREVNQLIVGAQALSESDLALVVKLDKGRKYTDDGMQDARIIEFPMERSAEIIAKFGDGHEEIVRRLASGMRRTRAAKWHSENYRNQLERAAEESVPNPAYKNDEVESAPPPVSSGHGWNRPMLEQMARSIRIAHALNPTGWAVVQAKGQLVLNVASNNVIYGFPTKENNFAVDPTGLLDGQSEVIESLRSPFQPGALSPIMFLRLQPDNVETTIEMFQDSHEQAIQLLANIGGLANQWQNHRDNLRHEIEATLGETLPIPEYSSKTPKSPLLPPPLNDSKLIRNHFAASGLHYTDAQIATFYTALQTKGFVVLSGISGTGKSKIATGFVEMLPIATTLSYESDTHETRLRLSLSAAHIKNRLIALPRAWERVFPPMTDKSYRIDVVIDGFRGTGLIGRYVSETINDLRLTLHKNLATRLGHFEPGDVVFLEPIVEEESGEIEELIIHSQQQMAADQELLAHQQELKKNHLFLSVRPDWRDSTSLLGYYNPLTQTYEWTEFLKVIIQARDNYNGPAEKRIAWFVILDEMNLAHVEYYFADLLSVIESGRDDAGWTREPLRMTYPETLDDEVPPHELKLPPNLYIIGTVNMDETTHAFSPKVLDRAFTIELADVDFSNYPIVGAGSGEAALTDGEKQSLLTQFTRGGRFALIDKNEIGDVVARHPRIRDDLQALNGVLQPHRMHFGYRVFDEICQYLFNNDENGMMTFVAAFDQAVFMKVLPKFTDSRARLQSPLHGVLAWAIDPGQISVGDVERVVTEFNDFYQAKASEAWVVAPAFPTVAGRVRDMLVALERDGFVSFG